jgi:hypothetical protein
MTNESRPILENIITDFAPENFVLFFRRKSQQFTQRQENLACYNDEYFQAVQKLGEIKFPDGDELLVCTLSAQKPLSERSGKKAQYEKAKKILKEKQVYAAGIFIFYDTNGNFRFSLVYPEYTGDKRQWSNFRRFTYFVSAEFTNKTFLKRIGESDFSTLAKIKEAFAVGPVTDLFYKDFFVEYDKLVQAVKTTNKIAEDKARDFVLLFAIRTIFLGFIQKRKWLGDNEKFIQSFLDAYQKTETADKFYEDWLSILFFEALNKNFSPRKHLPKEINSALQLAPYLNGGLFREKAGYDDQGWLLPAKEIASFFDFLFSHSFTIEESSLDDAELQLNPEFLGIIFERLVNKADGAVYTPRTEVDLMCRLSLVKWLMRNLSLPITPINLYELFFREGEAEDEQKEGSFSKKEALEILAKLESMAMCDPAVGSGAFLVGMMQVLDEIEQKLRKRFGLVAQSVFERKKQIISQSLYGVEVKEWAVWICQLRLWLSLFVDAPEDMRLSPTAILPSLDFKVRQGDSLVQRIGSKMFPVSGHATDNRSMRDKVNKLKNLKTEYFNNKTSLKDWEIKQRELAIYDDILQSEIQEKQNELNRLKYGKTSETGGLEGIEEKKPKQAALNFDKQRIEFLENEIEELRKQKQDLHKDKPLIWNIEFAEIFVEKEGFDIIIGNPPYVRQEDIADPLGKVKDKKQYKGCLQEMVRIDFPDDFPLKKKINAQSDLYTYFYIRALRLLNPQGITTFICSNSWLDVGYGVWLQEFLLKRTTVELIIDNHAKRSFEAADVNTIISLISASQKKVDHNHPVKFVAFKIPFEEAIFTENLLAIEGADAVVSNDVFRVYPVTVKNLQEAGMEYEHEGERKLDAGKYIGDKWGGKYLRAPDIFFTILEKGKDKLVKLGDIAEVRRGFTTGVNEFFYLDDDQIREWKIESEYLKPVIKSPRDSKTILVEPKQLKNKIFLCNKSKKELKDTNALKYIEWGERQKTKDGICWKDVSSVQGRKYWYGLGERKPREILWPMIHNDRLACFWNKQLVEADHNLFEITPFTPSLFSVITIFFRELYGRSNLGEGALKTEGIDINKFMVLDSRFDNLSEEFKRISSDAIDSLFTQCGIDPQSKIAIEDQEPKPLPDRAELDKVIFDALSLTNDERKEVYRAVCRLVWNRISKARSL